MHELLERRTRHTKTFELGNRKFKLHASVAPLHYLNGNALEDIDLTPREDRGHWLIDKAPHRLRILPDVPAYRYANAAGKQVAVVLKTLDEILIAGTTPEQDGDGFVWREIAPLTDYRIRPLPQGCTTILVLKSPAASRHWAWQIEGDIGLIRPLRGWDSQGRILQIIERREGQTIRAEWTGRTTTRQLLRKNASEVWTDDVTYPVYVDPTVNESITQTEDDCDTQLIGTYAAFTNGGSNVRLGRNGAAVLFYAGLRFQTIAIPQGATIDSATLTYEITSKAGSGPSVKFYGDDVDDAPPFSTGSRVRLITKTTASITASGTKLSTGTQTLNFQGIVQELISRGGWSSNNDMRFAAFNQAASGYEKAYMAAYGHPTASPATLDIVYTAGGGAVAARSTGRGLTLSPFLAPRSLVG